MITILTATYNREKLLPDLYHSLLRQTSKDFMWVIIDDGSSDGTKTLVQSWAESSQTFFKIKYIYQENGGRNRAINTGIKYVETEFTCLVDSDDYLTDDAIKFFSAKTSEISKQNNIAGIAGLKGTSTNKALNTINYSKITATNLERPKYGLEKDCCEVYKTEILKKHPFSVWPGEKFTPEAVVWNEIALEDCSLVWYNKVVCIIRYLEDGLTKGSWNLIKKNPMGYAMLFNHQLLYTNGIRNRTNLVLQFLASCFRAGEYRYILKCNAFLLAITLLPLGWILAIRRKQQIKKYCK